MIGRRSAPRSLSLGASAALLILGLGLAQPARAEDYTITDLGIIPGKTATVVFGNHSLNTAGQTTGFCNLGTIETGIATDWDLGNVPFLWTPHGGLLPLPMPPGMTYASGWSLNDHGHVVGFALNRSGDGRAVVWEKKTIRVLEPLPGDNETFPYAINNRGQVTGTSYRAENGVPGPYRPVVWDKHQIHVLPIGAYPGGNATAIDEKGWVVGTVHTGVPADFPFASLPALWVNGNLTVLPTLGGEFASAWDINHKGQIAGYSQTTDGAIRGCIWEGGVPTEQGSRGGSYTALWAINNKGQAVGESTDPDEVDHAILIDDGAVIDLNDRIPAGSGWTLVFADGINERGQISGAGFLNGQVRSFLLTPKHCH